MASTSPRLGADCASSAESTCRLHGVYALVKPRNRKPQGCITYASIRRWVGPTGMTCRGDWLCGGVGNGADMNSDTILAMSGLMALAAAVLTGALWGSPVVMASFRWFVS